MTSVMVVVDGSEVRRRRQALPGAPSVRDISRKAKVSPAGVSRIENGKQGAGEETLTRLAAALRCSTADITRKVRRPPPDRVRIEELERRVAALEAALRSR